jgi:hypothetical protein
VQSDIDLFDPVTVLYCKIGIYAGPRSDQMTIANAYTFFCDVFLYCDKASGLRLDNAQIVGCGTHTDQAIKIARGSAGVQIVRPWLEHYQGYSGTNQCAFIGVGLVDGYNGESQPIHGVSIHDPFCLVVKSGEPYHTEALVDFGACLSLRLHNPQIQLNSSLANFDAIVRAPAGTSYTYLQSKATVTGVLGDYLPKLFLNAGSGDPEFNAMMDGRSASEFASKNGRLVAFRLGAPAGADSLEIGTEGVAGNVFISTPTLTGAPSTRLWLQRAVWHAGSAPTSGTWQRGDIVFNRDASAGGKIGWICTASGAPGIWKAWGTIDA